jgi:hypothetical protein
VWIVNDLFFFRSLVESKGLVCVGCCVRGDVDFFLFGL